MIAFQQGTIESVHHSGDAEQTTATVQ